VTTQSKPGDDAPPRSKRLEELERGSSLWKDAWRRLKKNRISVGAGIVLIVMVLVCLVHPQLSHYHYDKADLDLGPTPPSWEHLMGTDVLGRDLFARITFGGRISFAVGLIATFVSFFIGVTWGGVAGYFGGRIDAVMMRIVDVLYTLPLLILVILLMVFFANDKTTVFAIWVKVLGIFTAHPRDPQYFPIFQIFIVFFAIGGISWLTMARIVRGQVISLRGQPFIEASRSIGVGDAALIFRHLVPNALGPIIVYTTLTIPEVMLTEAFLSFLGLGTQEPLASWGQLASSGAETMSLFPWMLVAPAVMLALTLFCFNFLGDGLRDALDPRIRKD
jgi:oligopeptide transport system permease protein